MRYIYVITNLVNGKNYIGRKTSTDPFNDNYFGSGNLIVRAIEKYGLNNFKKEIIMYGNYTNEEINEMERYYISNYKLGGKAEYNIAKGGFCGGNRKGCKLTEEQKQKMRKPKSQEFIQKMANGHSKKVLCVELNKIFNSANEAAEWILNGHGSSHIGDCCRKKRITAHGYHWKFVDGIVSYRYMDYSLMEDKTLKYDHHIGTRIPIQCVETGETFASVSEANKKYKGKIYEVLKGNRKTSAGLHWKYLKKE